jgi:uncharacterized protein YlxW (UPF0749 family)
MTRWATALGVLLAICVVGRFASAQLSVEEAQKRLQAKMATRPATTEPVGELERLRTENNRLRVEVSRLQMEVQTLRDALAQNSAAPAHARSGATTQPSRPSGPEDKIVGAWRGGDPAHGAGFVLTFKDDGSYQRAFLQYPQKENGHYRFASPDTMDMWIGDNEDRPHSQYRVSVEGTRLTLTPLLQDGLEVRRPVPMVMTREQ